MENTEKSSAPVGGGGAKEKVEKQARQLAYDVRYKVRGALKAQSGGQSDPATVKKAYLAQLGKSPANPAVKTRAKQMLVGEDYINMKGIVADGVASAMFKVFVDEHHEKDADGNVIPHEEINEDEVKEKTYKVRVTDKETGNSYVRNATRAKIAELRNNPNISSVEMTEYGEVTKSEKYKGSKTASVKAGKGIDYDGDGKKESSSKEHAGVVHNAIQKKKGGKQDGKDTRTETYSWKEAFSGLIEKKSEEEEKKITGKGVNNSKLIKVFPVEEDAQYGYDKEGNSLNPEDIKKKNEKDPNGKAKKEEDEDPRSIPTKMNLVKNKLRAMGLKMSHEPEGKLVEGKKKGLDGKECWDGYKLAGTKKKGGKTVDNCVKVDEGIEDIIARLEKKRISKGGNPDESPLGKKTGRAMKDQQDKARKKAYVRNATRAKIAERGVKTEEVVLEADSLSATVDRWEAARQKRMKQRQSYERPHWIPRDQDHEDNWGSSKGEKKKTQKENANLQNEKVESLDELQSTTLLSYSNKAANELAFKGDGSKKAQKSATGVKRAAGQLTMKSINKEEVNSSVQSALDSLNTYYSKNEKLHGSLIHNEDAALDFVKKKIEREHGKGAYVSKDNPMKPQSAADKAKARAHQAKVDAENAAERAKDPSQGRYPKG